MNKILDAVLKGNPSILKGNTIFTNAIQKMIKQRNALIKDDWNTLEKLANEGLGLAYGAYSEISRKIGILQSQIDEANDAFITFLKFQASKKDTRSEFFTQLKNSLLQQRPDINPNWLKALDALADGKIGNNVILNELKENREVESDDMINSAIDSTVAQATRSLMALTYAGFHNHSKEILKYPFAAHKDKLVDVFDNEIKQFEKSLEDSLKMLHSNISEGETSYTACDNIIRICEQNLPAFGRLQATLRLYSLSLKDEDLKSASKKVGKIAAKAGDLTRAAFASYASAYYLSLQSRRTKTELKVKKILAKLKYDSPIPNGKNYDISKINNAKKGEYVEVAGYVESINTWRESSKKLISQVILTDPSSDAKLEAVGLFVHFRHVGLQEGAYCILHGSWQTKSKINKNKPAVEIDKLAINELAKKSWKVGFLDLSDKFIDRWPGGLNIHYSLSPHVSKSDEEESKILGAGELIFKPFIN